MFPQVLSNVDKSSRFFLLENKNNACSYESRKKRVQYILNPQNKQKRISLSNDFFTSISYIPKSTDVRAGHLAKVLNHVKLAHPM